jgi:hypothetical protein
MTIPILVLFICTERIVLGAGRSSRSRSMELMNPLALEVKGAPIVDGESLNADRPALGCSCRNGQFWILLDGDRRSHGWCGCPHGSRVGDVTAAPVKSNSRRQTLGSSSTTFQSADVCGNCASAKTNERGRQLKRPHSASSAVARATS